jgi:GT2 family glycosyltransferase
MSDYLQAAKKTPVAAFLYNRPAHARSLFESLATCDRLDECDVYIYCDGPRGVKDTDAVSATRQVANEWADRLGAQVIERAQNLGLAKSIVNGVTELCSKYGRVIVLEDDFILNPSFLDYMVTSLDRYEHEPSVFQISGYRFPATHRAEPEACFLPLTTTWGWGTWARAWKAFDWNPARALGQLKDTTVRRKFDLDDAYPYATMLEERLENKNDSWGILFWWAVFETGGLVLYPPESLVYVGGFDDTGTHCSSYQWSVSQSQSEILNGSRRLELPSTIEVDAVVFDEVRKFLRNERYPSIGRRVRTKLEQYSRAIRQ